MNIIEMLEQMGANASLQSTEAKSIFMADTNLGDLAEEGKMWCLMVPEKDEDDDGDDNKNDDVKPTLQ